MTSSLKDISLSFGFSSYILLCFWISLIVTTFVVYYVFFFNVLKSFINDCRTLFSFFSSSVCRHKFSLSFSFKNMLWNIKRDDFFSLSWIRKMKSARRCYKGVPNGSEITFESFCEWTDFQISTIVIKILKWLNSWHNSIQTFTTVFNLSL